MPVVVALLLAAFPARAADPGAEFFESKVRPVLAEHCYGCHSSAAEANKKLKAGLKLDTRAGWQAGGDSGPPVVPGDPSKSLLIRAVEYTGDVPAMPPKGKLPDVVIGDLRKWVAMGAPDQRDGRGPPAPADTGWAETLRERRTWWSLRPVVRPPLPEVRDAGWSAHPIDRFVRRKQEEHGLTPSPLADRATLLRRVTYTLTGLPPTPDEVEAFLRDEAPDAYEQVVDRLLASPRFGERMATRWMDVIRYAETHGSEGDPRVPNAWRYRDHLIRAFNADVPFDRLVREHLAGDLLPDPRIDPATRLNESAVGTAHLRMSEHGFQPVDSLDELARTTENQIDVIGKAFLGLTVACARCHDHKFDAVSQWDYYALYGILASTRPAQVTVDDPTLLRTNAAELEDVKRKLRSAVAAAWLAEADAIPARLLNPPKPAVPVVSEIDRLRGELSALETRLAALEEKVRGGPAGPRPLAAWRFEGDARDALGDLHAELAGEATVRGGRLVLDGTGGHARSAPLRATVRAKTLEAWVALTSRDQRGSGVVSLETQSGAVFDAIVFGEQQPGKWIAGSDFFRRTRDLVGPAESSGAGDLVHVLAAYAPDGTISLFRNGEPYGKGYSSDGPIPFVAGDARVLIGLRHGEIGPLAGEVEEARLYDRALTAAEVLASFRAGPDRLTEADVHKSLNPSERDERAAIRKQVAEMRLKLAAAEAVPRVTDPWAQALTDAATDAGHPLHPWLQFEGRPAPKLAAAWAAYAEKWRTEIDARRRFNRENFRPLWDLTREAEYAAWTRHGVGSPPRPSPAGEFFVEPAGDRVVSGIYPAGVYTHLLSSKHNGILASPRFALPANVSVRLMGDRGGGVRVVVDNYPLGNNGTYPQSRPTRDVMGWVRLDTAYRKGADAYIEVATADDLTRPPPKSPPDGRSLVGVAQVVAHDGQEPPRDEAVPVLALLDGVAPASREQLAAKVGDTLRSAVTAWRDGAMTDVQAAYLDSFVRRGLLRNTPAAIPDAAALLSEYRRLEGAVPISRRAPGVLEAVGRDASLHVRGNHKTPGPAVPRGFLEVLGGRPYRTTGTGRRELADAFASPRNPLTARVMVNRLWQWVYGRGLIATPDNFGKLGEPPTHPELLDWLAAEFVRHGWSVKRMMRLMATARAFRTSSRPSAAAAAKDPANAWLTHSRLRRLDAEEVRDGLLAAGGELSPEMYGPSVHTPPLDAGRRSVYLAVVRNSPHPFLEVFDKPPALTTRGRRDVTTLPAQSLALMNSPYVAELTKRWGAKLAARTAEPPGDRIRGVFIAALGRPPTDDEVRTAAGYLAAAAIDHGLPADRAAADPRPWRDLVHAVVCLKETIYIR